MSGHYAKELGQCAKESGRNAKESGREASAFDDGAKEVDLDARELGQGAKQFGDDDAGAGGDAGNRWDAWRELHLLRQRFIVANEAKRDIHWGGFNIVRADGSVSFFPENISKESLRKFLTPSGGEVANELDIMEKDE